jgi:hypothetical protein
MCSIRDRLGIVQHLVRSVSLTVLYQSVGDGFCAVTSNLKIPSMSKVKMRILLMHVQCELYRLMLKVKKEIF